MKTPKLTMNDGFTIPQIGLGLWQVKDQAQFDGAFDAAVEAGYRHFDSAQVYHNEQMFGDAWKRSGLKREDIFITTKIAINNFGHKAVHESTKASLEKLQTDYIDLLLLHFPVTILRKKAWTALEEIQKEGGARSIGVSNYTIRHLEELKKYSNVTPAINQVELHIFLQQPELLNYCKEHNIQVEAYSPLAHAHNMDNETVKTIASKHNKTNAQIMLRWLLQQDLVVLPKSVNPSRIKENIDIFDFSLDQDDLEKLVQEDKNMRTCWSPVHVP